MKKCLINNLEDGGSYQLRTSNFKPIEGYLKILNEFDVLYESYQDSNSLFEIIEEGDNIKIIADTFQICFYLEEIESSNVQEIKEKLIEKQISEQVINLIIEEIEGKEYIEIVSIIEKIAVKNQKITIQYTDTLYGNSEFEIKTN
jgi:hypothetical protein